MEGCILEFIRAGSGTLKLPFIKGLGGLIMGLSLTELLVEYLRSPLGLDEKAPRFSWQLSSDKKDTLQTAVEIRVREGKSEEEVWDSGQLSTGVSTGIAYAGKN